jgi:hypothetical protein
MKRKKWIWFLLVMMTPQLFGASGDLLIDRTPPTVYENHASPMNLSAGGERPYSTTVLYKIEDDSPATTTSDSSVTVKVAILNRNTGELVASYNPAPANMGIQGEVTGPRIQGNAVFFDASSSSYPKGAYRAMIMATDRYGNSTTAYADMIKEGLAPIVSYPQENTNVVGSIAIKGTAADPDWQNSYPFEKYAVYIAEGKRELPTDLKNLGPEWKTSGILVPPANQREGEDPNPRANNIGFRPVQNDSVLAYLMPNVDGARDGEGLAEGDYSIAVGCCGFFCG